MAETPTGAATSGIGLSGILFVVFLTLKLVGVIAWSWWWVTAPLWLPPVAIMAVAAMACTLYIVFKYIWKALR